VPSNSTPFIFLSFANAKRDLGQLAAEHQAIRAELFVGEGKGLCEFEERFNLDFATLIDVFQSKKKSSRMSVFHYGGHAGDFSILLRDTRINGLPFHKLLAQAENLQLVFLNGCCTGDQAENLIKIGIPVVIATSFEIPDESAKIFAARFYKGLVEGHSIQTSFEQSEIHVSGLSEFYMPPARLSNPRRPKPKPELLWKIYKKNDDAGKWTLEDELSNPYFGLPKPKNNFLPGAPYISLKPYSEKEAGIFWGRGKEIKDIFNILLDDYANPVILLYGQSGVGKSSLLDAGLVPRLKSVYKVFYARRKEKLGAFETLKRELGLNAGSSSEFLTIWKEQESDGHPVFIVIDQLEEIFTKSDGPARELEDFCEFIRYLFIASQAPPLGKIVLSYRKEYHAEIENMAKNYGLPFTRYFLEPLKRDSILEIIKGPKLSSATRSHYLFTVEPGLPEMIADELAEDIDSPIAPILQILLTKAWEKSSIPSSSEKLFSKEIYHKLKENGLALSDFLNEQSSQISLWRPGIVSSGLLLDILFFHTTPLGTADSHSLTDIDTRYENANIAKEVIEKCVSLYLLAETEDENSKITYHLSHDTLALVIRSAFDSSQLPGQRANRILANQSTGSDAKEGSILNQRDIHIVREGKSGMRKWSADEEKLVENSLSFHLKEEHRKKRNRWLTAFGVLGLIILLFILVFSNNQKELFKAQGFYVKGVDDLSKKNFNQAAKEFVNALRYHDDWEWRSSLIQAISNQIDFTDSIDTKAKVLAISQDGTTIISGAATKPDGRGKINNSVIISYVNGSSRAFVLPVSQGNVERAALSSDDKFAVLGCSKGDVLIVDLATHAMHNGPTSHGNMISKLSISSNNELLVYSNELGQVWLYDFRSRKETVLVAKGVPSRGLCFSRDGRLIALSSNNTQIILFAKTPQGWVQQYAAPVSDDVIMDASFSPDGLFIAVGGFDASVRIVKTGDGKVIKRIYGNMASINSVCFSNSGQEILSGGVDGSLRLFDVESSRELCEFTNKNYEVTRAIFKENKNSFEFGTSTGSVYQCARYSNDIVSSFYTDSTASVLSLAFSFDNKLMATGGDDKSGFNKIRVWDLQSRKLVKSFSAHKKNIVGLKFNRYDDILASASEDSTVKFWGTRNWRLKSSSNYGDQLTCLNYSDHMEFLAGGHQRQSDTTKGMISAPPYSRMFFYASDGELTDSLNHVGGSVYSIATAKENLFATGGGDNTARLWDREKKKEVYRFPRHGNSVWAVAISTDDSLMASADIDGMIYVYDLKDKARLHSLTGHSGGVFFLAFSPDGKWLASAGNDYTIRLWDLESEQSIVLRNFDSPVWMLEFSRDRRWLYACGLEKEVKRFDMRSILDFMSSSNAALMKKMYKKNFKK
jgi:WD40 repeat protein